MSELYRDFIDNEMDDIITALNGTITPTPVNSELYRNFLNRKADDIITALNGTITPAPIGDELYRDFIERKFDDVISSIGSYIPPVSFPSVSGAVCSFDSQYAGLPLKSHIVDIDYTGSAISGVNILHYGSGESGVVFTNNLTILTDGSVTYNNSHKVSDFVDISNITSGYVVIQSPTLNLRNNGLYTAFSRIAFYDDNEDFISLDEKQSVTLFYTSIPTGAKYARFMCGGKATDIVISGAVVFNITFSTPIYGGSYDCLTGIVTSTKAADGTDITPVNYQCSTVNIETQGGVNNIFADTGDTTIQYIKIGGNT